MRESHWENVMLFLMANVIDTATNLKNDKKTVWHFYAVLELTNDCADNFLPHVLVHCDKTGRLLFRALRSSGYFYQVMAASWLEIKKLHLFSLRHATKPNTEMLMVLGHIFPAHKAVKAKESVRNDRILLYLWRFSAVAVAVHDRACRLERSRGGSMVAYNHVTKTRAPLCSFAKLFHAPPKPQLMRLDSRVGLRW